MPNLLMYRVMSGDEEVLWPWEQNPVTRIELDDHAHHCPTCTRRPDAIFDGCGTRDIVVLRCGDGIGLLRTLIAQKDRRAEWTA
jgi:hypothetical protein